MKLLTPVPLSNYTAECVYCHEVIDLKKWGDYRRGSAWFKKQKNTQGSNSAALVDWTQHYACRYCIGKITAGIPVHQLALFYFVDEPDPLDTA
jgi:hypothetical protein